VCSSPRWLERSGPAASPCSPTPLTWTTDASGRCTWDANALKPSRAAQALLLLGVGIFVFLEAIRPAVRTARGGFGRHTSPLDLGVRSKV
jgi:hypothetical protein